MISYDMAPDVGVLMLGMQYATDSQLLGHRLIS